MTVSGGDRRSRGAAHPDTREAVELVRRFYDELGFDPVDNSPLSESWRSAPGTPMWQHSIDGQSREELIRNLQLAVSSEPAPRGGAVSR